jgi:hypothetical protein
MEMGITMVGVEVRGVRMGVGEGIMEVVGGMGVAIHHQDGKIQGEGKEAGIGIGHLQDGMETERSVSMATALHHHLVTEKVSFFRNTARFISLQPSLKLI